MKRLQKAGVSAIISAALLFSINVGGVSAAQGEIKYIEAERYITQDITGRSLPYKTSEELVKSYGGTVQNIDLNSLPEGSAVIKLDSLQELDALLASVKSQAEKALNQNIKLPPPPERNKTNNISPYAIGDTKTGQTSSVLYDGAGYDLLLYSNYILTNVADGSWAGTWHITSVTPSTALSGWTAGLSWQQSAANSTKVNDFKWISIASGQLSFLVFVGGVGQIATVPVNGSHNVEI